jgi:hypothetical protein
MRSVPEDRGHGSKFGSIRCEDIATVNIIDIEFAGAKRGKTFAGKEQLTVDQIGESFSRFSPLYSDEKFPTCSPETKQGASHLGLACSQTNLKGTFQIRG